MSFRRLTSGHLLAFVAALALLLAMAPDWYTDKLGENYRFYQHDITPQLNQQSGTPSQSALEADAAQKHEKNAWQASALIDRLILLALLATAALAIAAAFLRAAGRDVGPPSPSGLASLVGLLACALVAYRIIQPPGLNPDAVVKWGAPLGLLCAGLVTVGSRMAMREERERPASAEPTPAAAAGGPEVDAGETPAPPAAPA